MKTLPHVGSTATISLPDEAIQGVPAKVDTGADSSAIWASDIQEKQGVLSFKLFGKGSPYYSGRILKTRDYKVVSVKNSFGQSEYRFKVKLRLNIEGRTIKATIGLSDRSSSRYPVLIGRRTLQGKFLVNVSRTVGKQFQVLMISTKKTPPTADFAKRLEKYGKRLRLTYASYDDIDFRVGETGNSIVLTKGGQDIADFDLVHFKTTARFQDIAAAMANYLQQRGTSFIDTAVQHFPGSSKLYQYVILADNDIPVPATIYRTTPRMVKSFNVLQQELGLPFILKDIHGNKGEYNYLIDSQAAFKKALKAAEVQGIQFIAQAFIPNDRDYRVLVFGAKLGLVMERARQTGGTHLNNTSQGAEARLVPASQLPAEVQVQCIKAAKLLGRQVAGVDFVQDKASGLWYCLEVNDGPQIATGKFRAEKHAAFAAYLERKLSQ